MPKNMMFKPKNGIQFFYPDLLNFPKPGDMQRLQNDTEQVIESCQTRSVLR